MNNKFTNLYTKRDRIAILVNVLMETERALNKTRIIHRCNLNYRQLRVYLDFLLTNKLVTKKIDADGKELFVTTQKGKFFVKEFQCLQVLMQ